MAGRVQFVVFFKVNTNSEFHFFDKLFYKQNTKESTKQTPKIIFQLSMLHLPLLDLYFTVLFFDADDLHSPY